MSDNERIVIVGAGPAGLGAAWRLNEMGHTNWVVIERDAEPGGLSGSVTDSKGFTWDYGGHVLFSHYDYFDALMDELIAPDGWLQHERESWVWARNRFIPYPFQNNIRHLPGEEMGECLRGLIRARMAAGTTTPANFAEWSHAVFGEGIMRVFMAPYNFKVWGCPLDRMSYSWIGDRVAVLDLERIVMNVVEGRDDVSWGPNNRFRFPAHGGTGAIWRECARRLPQDKLRFKTAVEGIDWSNRRVRLSDGSSIGYDLLFSTMPLTLLLRKAGLEDLWPDGRKLVYSSSHIYGIGLEGTPPPELATKCWMYFPEDDNPFYRVTLFSNYSPNNVPDIARYWSLMAEVCSSPFKPVPDDETLLESVIEGMINTKLIRDARQVASVWSTRIEHSYPTPTLSRDDAIMAVLPELDRMGISSRGRFGAWRYEVGNQDHCVMQGVEWANHVMNGEEEVTVWHPEKVNAPRQPKTRKE